MPMSQTRLLKRGTNLKAQNPQARLIRIPVSPKHATRTSAAAALRGKFGSYNGLGCSILLVTSSRPGFLEENLISIRVVLVRF